MKKIEILFLNIYKEAQDFHFISKRIIEKDDRKSGDKMHIKVAIVNGIFAIELYLKAILAYEGKKIAKIHKLNELFDKISEERKKELNGLNIYEFLKEESNAFIEWRYSYEYNLLMISMKEMKKVLEVLEKECAQINKVIP